MININLSENAIKRVKSIMDKKNNPNLNFRVQVNSGGCSGFEYKFALDENKNDDDLEYNFADGVTMIVDETSAEFLENATIDFSFEMVSSAFKVINENVSNSCGCGNSFSI